MAPFTRPFGEATVDALLGAAIARNIELRRLLDHGSGTGQVARVLHGRLPHAFVRCLDPAGELLSAAPAPPLDAWAETQTGTAADLAGCHPFDGVVSAMALPFVGDVVADLSLLRGALRPGGLLAASTLGVAEEVEPFAAFWSTFASLDGDFWQPDRYPHFRLGDPTTIKRAVREAGFESVTVSTVSATRHLSVEAVWEWLSSALPVGSGGAYTIPDPATIDAARARFLEEHRTRVHWRTQCRVLTASAPG